MRAIKRRIGKHSGLPRKVSPSTKSGEKIAVDQLKEDLRKHARVAIAEAVKQSGANYGPLGKPGADVKGALTCLGNWLIATGVVVPGKRLDTMLQIGVEAIEGAYRDVMGAPSEE